MSTSRKSNRLIDETSPYLLQHAYNPVDWYPWGEEALARARVEDKPILLSIGYSACHWCHVMEHESFENDAIAELMNKNFVCIKVDREERPDLDSIYMNAIQMINGQGGWPMTVFLTPDGVPFYGGTYYPPEDRHNIPGFPRVLEGVSDAYRQRRGEVIQTGKQVLDALREEKTGTVAPLTITRDILEQAFQQISRSFDPAEGGFGRAPKFPAPMVLEFLLKVYHRTGDPGALRMVDFTCRKMAQGGMYDQLGGGFHRYSTDTRWLVPHFEKMLYDNAQLSNLYLHLYQISGDEFFSNVVRETLDYVEREMTSPAGGFYSTQDADSEGHEGKFFVWELDEVERLLPADDARLFAQVYDISKAGNFEGKNIPNLPRSLVEVSEQLNLPLHVLIARLDSIKATLFAVREKRVKPGRDEKILTAWNGLMINAFAQAGRVLNEARYLESAQRAATFLLKSLCKDGLLLRTWKDGKSKLNGYLEDYANLADALLTLYETTGERTWFDECYATVQKMIDEFWDEQDGGFFFTGKSHEELIVRNKDYFDNATPSGNSIAAGVLLRLASLTGEDTFSQRAVSVFQQVRSMVERYPTGFGQVLSAMDYYLTGAKEIAIVGDPGLSLSQALKKELWRTYIPNIVVAIAGNDPQSIPPQIALLSDRVEVNTPPVAYVCQHFVCLQPAKSLEEFRAQLSGQ